VYLMGEGLKLPMLNGMGRTDRIDNWWAQPAVMGIGLILAVLWTLWRVVFFSDHIDYNVNGAHVISPMFSPNVLDWDMFSGWDHPSWVNAAVLILWIPFSFRGTCYYMRRVYYRTFFASPVACWVDEPEINKKIGYQGEKRLFLINNLHRYFLYMVIPILLIKWWDITHTMTFSNDGYGFTGGTIILFLEAVCLTFYVTSCHALRHLAGGMLDRWTTGISKVRGALFSKISIINRDHGFWFWISLVLVFVGDAWTIACSKGMINDFSLVLIGGA